MFRRNTSGFAMTRGLPEYFRFWIFNLRFWKSKIKNQKWKMLSVAVSLILAFLGLTTAQASVSGSTSYSESISLPVPINEGMGLSVSVSASISGSMTITGPGGDVVATIGVSGPGSSGGTVILSEVGTYSVSESYHLEVRGQAFRESGEAEDDASGGWSFNNSTPGGIATFRISSYVSLSEGGSSGNAELSVSGMSVRVTATEDIPAGDSVSASVDITWGVDTPSPSIRIPPGTIEVYTNLVSATFSLSGPDGYSGGGKLWKETGASAGQYTITYDDVSDVYETPPQETKTLSPGETVTFTGEYILVPSAGTGTIEVHTNLPEATFSLSGPEIYPEVYSGDGELWTRTEVSAGEYTITYGDVFGYRTPRSETVILATDSVITFTGEYVGIGAIEVRTNLSSATFNLSGPDSYSGRGRSWIETEASVGEYTITYTYVSSYKTPPSETKTLVPGGTISFTGEYSGIGTIEVRTNLSSATFNLSGPESYSGSGTWWTKTEVSAGEYTVEYDYVPGYGTPASETKTLTSGGRVAFTGAYKDTGTIEVHTNLELATFDLSGTYVSYSGNGESWTNTEAVVGEYTITYGDVPGYKTPTPRRETLARRGDTISFTGEYIGIGTIEVHTNLASASFDLSGPGSYSGSGESWVQTEAPVGDYTIAYGDAPGSKIPPSETKTLTPGETVTFTGEYIGVGTIEVHTNLTSATFELSGPAGYSGNGESWIVTEAPTGEYTITYGDVPGSKTPASETKTLTPGETVTFTGEYIGVGAIEVHTNLASATFELSGPASYSGSGESWIVTEAPAGDYTITYGDAPGSKTPPSETKTLTPGETVTFTGEYIGVGAIEVHTNLASATFELSGPANYSGSGESWTQTETPTGDYTITYADVLGYKTPSSETKTLTPGEAVTFTGEYIGVGAIEVHTNLASATFELSGPASYSGSGESWTKAEAPVGEYTIIYGDVPGYKTPLSETQTLIENGTISLTGTYLPSAVIHSVEISGSMAKAGDIIVVSMLGGAGGTATFSITDIVNDITMTESASTPGLYTGEYVVPEGVNATDAVVSVKLIDASGIEATNEDKTATIDTKPPAIESVDMSGSPARKAGDIITVSLLGEPGGMATFSIADIAHDIPMLESEDSPGTYEGSYTVVEAMNVKEAKVTVRLADAAGNTSADESKTASISIAPWDVNSDGVIDLLDIEAIGSNLGRSPTPELDINSDGAIDALDLALVGMHFGEEYGPDGEILAAPRPLSRDVLALFADPCYLLLQNYPNPCNPGTWIPFILAEPRPVVITIYSPTGQLIRRLDLGHKDPGIHISRDRAAYWDGRNEFGEEAASGVYFYHIRSGDFSTTRKMLVSR